MTGPAPDATLLDSATVGAVFDAARHSVFRLETRQTYAIPADDDELVAFRTGAPRPERSVRTSAWLRRIAAQTVTRQVSWSRLRVIDYPLSEYTRFELVAFVESQAAGEEIRLVESSVGVDDFWLVDGGTEHAVGVLMHYDDAGHLQGREQVVDPNALAGLRAVRDRAWPSGVPLNVWLASRAR